MVFLFWYRCLARKGDIAMFGEIKQYIDRYRLMDGVDTIIAACSGGTDSLALVLALNELRATYGYTLVIAHLNHGLRGAESAADYDFVANLAASLALPFCGRRADAAAFAREQNLSLQEGARELRYDWLQELAQGYEGAVIATGHHRGDQAETLLLQLLRGAGSKGLGGIRPRQGNIIRPLLSVNRITTAMICKENGWQPREDSSNAKTVYLRNRVRLELMPLLQERFSGQIEEILGRTATILADEYDFMRNSAETALPQVADVRRGTYNFDCRAVAIQPIALQREILRLAIEKIRGHSKGISLEHVEKLISMLMQPVVGKRMTLPGGVEAVCQYERLLLSPKVNRVDRQGLVEQWLPVPGSADCPAGGGVLSAGLVAEPPIQADGVTMAVFDADQLKFPLMVRSRRPGDRFSPRGGIGSKKLKEYFIDRKVPLEDRDRIPLLCDGEEIVWVCGCRAGRHAAPTEDTRRFLVVSWEKKAGES